METNNIYVCHAGRQLEIESLDAEDRQLFQQLEADFHGKPNSADFRNRWMARFRELGDRRGQNRRDTTCTTLWRIFQDLGSRLAIAEGWTKPDPSGKQLQEVGEQIRSRYGSVHMFCQLTGVDEQSLNELLRESRRVT